MFTKKLKARTQIALWSCSISAISIVAGPAVAEEPLLELRSVGLYDWPENAKDQKAVEAFKLLRDRLDDLALELDMDPGEAQLMQMGWDMLTARSALRLAPTENGIDASFVLSPENGSTEAMQQQLSMFAMMGGMEFQDQGDGIAQAMGPMGPMNLGFDADRIWLALGESEPATLDVSSRGLPDGATPIMSGRVDFDGLVQMFAPQMAEELRMQSEMFMGGGAAMFIGPDASILEFAVGVDDESMHMVSRMLGAKASMEAMGMGEKVLFTKRDLRAVPQDAVQFQAMPTNIKGMLDTMRMAMEMSGDDAIEEIGVNLFDDILANIGDRAMYYQSEVTGGGGLSSLVLMVDLRDADGMADAHGKLVQRLNQLAADEIDGYARVHTWDVDGTDGFSMTAPGLPIPFEPSWAISQGKLVFTLSPMALSESLAQLNGRRDTSILNDASFQSAVLSRMPGEGAVSLYYTDAPRMAAKGYGMTNMLTSALANAARSPEHPDRVEGSLMPSYHDFVSGIAPMGGVSAWDGDDLVSQYFGDRSVLVQLSAGLGTVADLQALIVPAFAAGAMLPALGQARERANQLKSATQLRSIAQGLIVYGSNNDDQPPVSVDVLIDQGILTRDIFVSPQGSAWDGGPDYTVRLTEDAVSSFNAQYIVGIDRAAYVNGEWIVNVAFADAHVEALNRSYIEEILQDELNEGAAKELQIEGF
ncbi:MAG: hypothetical protein ACX94C_07035 [Phycisphaerales bacterium]